MTQQVLDQLRAALRLLAMPADAQIAHVRSLGVELDEIALEFDDIAPARTTLIASHEISPTQAAAVGAVDRQLRQMSSAGPSRWTSDAAMAGDDWRELRQLAKDALEALT
jgi:hypothetical protein